MPRLRRKTERAAEVVESKFRFCKIQGLRVFIGICEEKCEEKDCPIVRVRLEKKMKRKLQARARRQKKKIEAEQKKLDKLGLTRNLLLKPEDINDGKDKKDN